MHSLGSPASQPLGQRPVRFSPSAVAWLCPSGLHPSIFSLESAPVSPLNQFHVSSPAPASVSAPSAYICLLSFVFSLSPAVLHTSGFPWVSLSSPAYQHPVIPSSVILCTGSSSGCVIQVNCLCSKSLLFWVASPVAPEVILPRLSAWILNTLAALASISIGPARSHDFSHCTPACFFNLWHQDWLSTHSLPLQLNPTGSFQLG